MTARIIGTGSAVPAHKVTNDDLSKVVETNDEWISSRTGIKERRLAGEETTVSMSVSAARKALENGGVDPLELDLIIVATCSPDYFFPNTACCVQDALGAVNAVAFDLSAACSGFLFGLNTVQAYMKAGVYKKALLVGAETMSKLIDWEDRSTCVLFGDGAGAAVLQAEEQGMIDMVQYSDGHQGPVLTCKARETSNFLFRKSRRPTISIWRDSRYSNLLSRRFRNVSVRCWKRQVLPKKRSSIMYSIRQTAGSLTALPGE